MTVFISTMVVLLLARVGLGLACKTNLDCQLNGACTSGVCVCDAAWTGSVSIT